MITLWLLGVWVHNPLRYDVIEQRNGLSNYFIHEYFGPIEMTKSHSSHSTY